jgi:asparagine synthase (glutamine-hydrolysing)
VVVSRADIARHFSDVVYYAERPLLRTAPTPMYLLSKLVRASGTKVVLTGEGADEVFAGYDLFREGKVRRFWARQPHSKLRPRLLERLYPYLQRSPVSQRAITQQFFGRGLELADKPGFAHGPRWQSAAALQRLFTPAFRDGLDVVARLVDRLPVQFPRWTPLAQDQYLEMRTLLSGYLLSSQGDRMLMGNSVEGRFPFLDKEVVQLASTLPDSYKLKVLDEKHVLKRAAEGKIAPEILARKKQPYRAPDGIAFSGDGLPEELGVAMGGRALKDAGIFEPGSVERLWAKCRASGAEQLSNADNMAVVGVLSTQLLHARLVLAAPAPAKVAFKTVIER